MKSGVAIGIRVRMSAGGAMRCARLGNKAGTTVGGSVCVNSISGLFVATNHLPPFIANTWKYCFPAWAGQSRAEQRQ
jgi:hypothetical protein